MSKIMGSLYTSRHLFSSTARRSSNRIPFRINTPQSTRAKKYTTALNYQFLPHSTLDRFYNNLLARKNINKRTSQYESRNYNSKNPPAKKLYKKKAYETYNLLIRRKRIFDNKKAFQSNIKSEMPKSVFKWNKNKRRLEVINVNDTIKDVKIEVYNFVNNKISHSKESKGINKKINSLNQTKLLTKRRLLQDLVNSNGRSINSQAPRRNSIGLLCGNNVFNDRDKSKFNVPKLANVNHSTKN